MAAAAILRSRCSSVSSEVQFTRLADDPALTQMNIGKLPVGITELHFDRTGRGGPAAPYFCKRVFETGREIDPNPMLAARDRIDNRLTAALSDAGDDEPRLAF